MPVVPDELRESIAQALDADNWKNGIEVISALPGWITLRVACRRMSADRMTRYITELAGGVPNLDRTELATAFREVLLNAMEHGAGFDPDKVIEVAAVRTARTLSASPSRDAFLLLSPDVLPLGVTDAGCCAAGPR